MLDNLKDFFKFVPGSELNSQQLTEVTKLIFDTGYYLMTAVNNKLGLSAIDFHKKVSVIPVAEYIISMWDNDNNLVGFFIATTKIEANNLDSQVYNYPDTLDIQNAFRQIDYLYSNDTENNDLILHNIVIRDDMRNKGLCNILFSKIVTLAKLKNCRRIFISSWESNKHAIDIFKHYGAQNGRTLDFTNTIYKNRFLSFFIDIEVLSNREKIVL